MNDTSNAFGFGLVEGKISYINFKEPNKSRDMNIIENNRDLKTPYQHPGNHFNIMLMILHWHSHFHAVKI